MCVQCSSGERVVVSTLELGVDSTTRVGNNLIVGIASATPTLSRKFNFIELDVTSSVTVVARLQETCQDLGQDCTTGWHSLRPVMPVFFSAIPLALSPPPKSRKIPT
jgi:hypothetical protein